MSADVVPIPLWRHPRRTGVLLVILGTLVLLFGVSLTLESVDLERRLERELSPPPEVPPASTSSPPTTSS